MEYAMSYKVYNRHHSQKKKNIVFTLWNIFSVVWKIVARILSLLLSLLSHGSTKLYRTFRKLPYRAKLGVILTLCIVGGSLIVLMLQAIGNDSTKLSFRRTYNNGIFAYEGDSPQVGIKTDIGTTSNGATISVARQGST